MVTSLPSFSLSLSLSLSLYLSLSPNVPHAQYRTRFRASYNTEREREREIDGSDVIIVALKLAMSLHFPMPKIRTIAVSSHFPLPKNRTFRFSLHTSCLTIVALKFAIHTFRCQKNSPSLFRLSLSLLNGASRATSDRKPKTNDQILPSPIIGSAEALPILCVRYILPWRQEGNTSRQFWDIVWPPAMFPST